MPNWTPEQLQSYVERCRKSMRPATDEDRQRLGLAAVVQPAPSAAPAAAATRFDDAVEAGKEVAELHVPFRQWLEREDIPYLYHRPDRASGICEGQPDFSLFLPERLHGRCEGVFIEFKSGNRKPTKKQVERIAELQAAGYRCLVTCSLREAQEFVKGESL